MKHLALFLIALMLGGCASTGAPSSDTGTLMADAQFRPPSEKITTDGLFDASPAMKDYLRSAEYSKTAWRGGARGLMDAMYTRGQLQLEYDSTTTRNAADTFATKSGNCLSLLIMTASLARELGLVHVFQTVEAGDTWTRNGELYMSNMHVNLLLGRHARFNYQDDRSDLLTVDFLPPQDMKGFRFRRIDEGLVFAMYLNNRATEALAENRIDDAYWWARKAVVDHPDYAPAINTLGVVYQRRGLAELAERAYRFALQRNPDSDVALYNLVPLLAKLGKHEESQRLAKRVASIRPVEPFHYFRAGVEAMQREDYALARDLFRKEVARAPYYDEFNYWLGMAYVKLGDYKAAHQQIELALKNSSSDAGRDKYSAKLRHLQSMGRSKTVARTI